MNKISRILWGLTFGMSALTGVASAPAEFDKNFSDSTLRLDYVFGASPDGTKVILLDGLSAQGGWAGRRTRLAQLPRHGNGQITVTDKATGDTLYRTSFSTLFHEWTVTPEAKEVGRSFENTFLVPMPLRPANVNVNLDTTHGETMATMTHTVDPADILIARRPASPRPHRYIRRSSHPETAIDVAILGEGYTKEQMDSFYVDAEAAVNAILSYAPFDKRADDFNFVAVETPSEQTGVSIPRFGDWRRSALDAHFSTFYSNRYMTTRSVKKIHDALADIPYEHIIILANTPEYGGGGIYNSYTLTTSRNKDFPAVVTHEFGHSFGGLADEYWYDTEIDDTYADGVEPWEPNITTLVDFPSKWKHLVKEGTPIPTPAAQAETYPVGAFEGAGYRPKGLYRPVDNCLMRILAAPFCPACVGAVDSLIDFYVAPETPSTSK